MTEKIKEPYYNAPIIEALFDIQIDYGRKIEESEFISLANDLKNEFPKSSKQITSEFKIEFGQPKPEKQTSIVAHNVESLGHRLTSTDEKRVIQVLQGAFAYSCLKPYPGWENIITGFSASYDVFYKKLSPKTFKRIVLKYINNFAFPADEVDEYLNIKPMIGSGTYSFLISGAQLALGITSTEANANGEIRLNLKPKMVDGKSLIEATYDITVFRQLSSPASDIKTLMNTLEELRKFKNDIFEANITDKTRELFK